MDHIRSETWIQRKIRSLMMGFVKIDEIDDNHIVVLITEEEAAILTQYREYVASQTGAGGCGGCPSAGDCSEAET